MNDTDNRYSLHKHVYPPDERCISGRRKTGSGGCMRPRVDGTKYCREHLKTNKAANERQSRARKFVPDFVADPSKLPKRPPGG